MDRRLDRGQATRQRLIEVATELFADRGYEGTSIEAVLERAGVSRGSLYHHFRGKDRLFEAVVEAVHAKVGEATLAAATASGATEAHGLLKAAELAWIRLAGDAVVRRILLIDAPTVLGWRRWRAIEEQYGLGMLKAVLQEAADAGRVPAQLVEPFAHILLAAGNEMALVIALADDIAAAQNTAEIAVEEFLNRLLQPTEPREARSSPPAPA
ncbi:TetR/AcrR family transcriptional regulator [Actinomadura montaniterrae]|uniref:TetR/AcrR family transcriptional regulator n=1 Tax=Actinomadura montaniterrae TaxID=1803903 RepID=A0A6L3VQB9_9ACTN|nr:TetR/AcrR family transcriptional regulator [Actinomadura montaniterrae]KAB2378953.1 TetR/AcrR family transcriptional regulator [Actinomadura montaniterrae]